MPQTAPEGDPRTRHLKYVCTACGTVKRTREDLTAKRVIFTTMGSGFRTLRSRTVAWLCANCLAHDEAWSSDKFSKAPGMAGTKIARSDDET